MSQLIFKNLSRSHSKFSSPYENREGIEITTQPVKVESESSELADSYDSETAAMYKAKSESTELADSYDSETAAIY